MAEERDAGMDLYEAALLKLRGQGYEHADKMYEEHIAKTEEAYRRIAEEANVNSELAKLAARRSDDAAGIRVKAGSRTIGQRNENSLRNELGSIDRQKKDYRRNVEHALNKLAIHKAAEENSNSARKAAEEAANRLSQDRFNAELGLQQQQLDLYKDESEFYRAYRLYLSRLTKPRQFKNVTGIKVKKLPVPRRPAYIISVKDAKGNPIYKNTDLYEKKTSRNEDGTVTEYYVAKALIYEAKVRDIDIFSGTGTIKGEKQLLKEINSVVLKPATALAGTPEGDAAAKDPDYIKFSGSYGGAPSFYVTKSVADKASAANITLDVRGVPKGNAQLMLELYGAGPGEKPDYGVLAENLKENKTEIIRTFGYQQYAVMSSYADCREAGASSLCVGPVNDAMNTLELMVMHPDMYQGESPEDYANKLIEQFGAVELELSKVVPVWQSIEGSGNLYSYDRMLRSFIESAFSTLTEQEAEALPDIDTLCDKVSAALAGEPIDSQAQMIIGKLPKTITDMLTYDSGLVEDDLRRYNDLTPKGLYEKLESADMPAWFVMPEVWTEESFGSALNTCVQHEYWIKTLGEGYDGIFTDNFPTAEELTELGYEQAKKTKGNDYKITDDFAYYYGILTIKDEIVDQTTDNGLIIGNDEEDDGLWNLLKSVSVITGSGGSMAQELIEKANAATGNLLWKKYSGAEVTDEDYKPLRDLGFTDIIDKIDSMDTVEYKDLPKSIRDQMKEDILAEGRYAYYDFTPSELEMLKTSGVDEIERLIAEESNKQEPDKQWLGALKLYRYYKNDLRIEVTGDYEADRTAAKKVFLQRLYELTGYGTFEEICTVNALNKKEIYSLYPEKIEQVIPEEWQEVSRILNEAPPELFMNTAEETQATYKSGEAALVSGLRSGITLGLASLAGENVADPEEFKRMALLGSPVGGTEFYKYGRFYNPAIAKEDAIIMQNNPWGYWIGNIVGGIPAMIVTGGLSSGIAQAFGAGTKLASFIGGFVPSAIQGGVSAAAGGGDIGDIIEGAVLEGTFGGISLGWLSDAAHIGIGKLLVNAPGILQKTLPKLAGATVGAISNAGLSIVSDVASGREINWEQTLASLPVDFVFSLVSGGYDGADLPEVKKNVDEPETYVHPMTGDAITVPKGKSLADVDAEAAKFYDGAAKIIGDITESEVNKAIRAYTELIELPKELLPDFDLKSLTDAYRAYEARATLGSVFNFVSGVESSIGIVSNNSKLSSSPDTVLAGKLKSLEGIREEIKPFIDSIEGNMLQSISKTEADVSLTKVDYGGQYAAGKNGRIELKPNVEYTTPDGYTYSTDGSGRINDAKGKLVLGESERNTYAQRNVGGDDRRATDEGGHLIARIFKGSGDIDNLVPMDATLNRGEWKAMENSWKKALGEGGEVFVQIRPIYEGTSKRPVSFVIKYKIEGKGWLSKRFLN